jgi:hypothetical protein
MNLEHVLITAFIFLAFYMSGMMTTLQLQHFSLYPMVGRQAFRDYIAANNRAAIIPSIVPALLLTLVTAVLSFLPQRVVPLYLIRASLLCNCVNIASTVLWQARIHSEFERLGYQEELVNKLIETNWVRTCALLVQAVLAALAAAHTLAFLK